MNPTSTKSKKKTKITSLLLSNNSSCKAANNILELSHELSEKLDDGGSHYENKLETSRAVPGNPILSSSCLSNYSQSCFKQRSFKSMTKKKRNFTKIANFQSKQGIAIVILDQSTLTR